MVLLGGCGGGGGDGGGAETPVVYGGNTNPAVISSTNASQLTADVVGDETGGAIGGIATDGGSHGEEQSGGRVDLARRLSRGFRDTALGRNAPRRLAAGVQIDETEPCDGGSGTARTVGTLDDATFTGTLTIFYNQCLTNGDILHGTVTQRVDVFDFSVFLPADATLTFTRLTIRGPGISADQTGSLRTELIIPGNRETVTENLVTLDNFTGRTTKSENLRFEYVYDNIFSPTSYTASFSGRNFHYVHGFVDAMTSAPLYFGTFSQFFPDGGEFTLTGSAGGAVRVTALSSTLARLGLDLDGDTVFEGAATLKWSDLSGPVGADLGDADSDGMHNSWETANDLDPLNPADALQDLDGDGASNRGEYLAGTGVNDSGSTPPPVGLAVSMSDAPDPATVGGALTYTINVSNTSAPAAADVVASFSLPADVMLISATPSQGSCTGVIPLTCSLGSLGGFGDASIVVQVSPTAEGLLESSVSVSSGAIDPDPSNNVATSTTTVGQAVGGIQGMINAAFPGDTVEVGPGTYVGNLNFGGKDITLQSSAGPASTIIHGNQGTAVEMGPGGTLRGFTVTGSFASFGAGISVHGAGSLIAGNVFTGNTGGAGVAIGGNTASPTIERNVFRNNACDNQFTSGVVTFINVSSPVIVNNVFENNQCRAINLQLPQFQAPQVMNNSFVGNATGVRVDRRVPQTTQIFRNNILVQNGIGLEIEFGADSDNPVWTNNLVFGNTTDYSGTADQTGTNGNLSTDPMFVDAAAGDYHLQAGSPAIDAGSAVGAPLVDYDGTSRPLDGNGDTVPAVDIGAFEAPQLP